MAVERGWVITFKGRALLGAPGYDPPMTRSAFLFGFEADAKAALEQIETPVREQCAIAAATLVVDVPICCAKVVGHTEPCDGADS